MMTYKQAIASLTQKRKTQLDLAAVLLRDAFSNNPKLMALEKELRVMILAESKGEKIDNNKKATLEKQKSALLKELNLTETPPDPSCKKCNDTGFIVGAYNPTATNPNYTQHSYCVCIKRLVLGGQQNIEIPLNTFANIDYTRFDPAHAERNIRVYEKVQKICDKYPLNKTRIITLLGTTGTGKTLLAGCAASSLLKKGYTVAAVTAFGFVNRALKFHTTFDDEKQSHLQSLLDSDLLIIDDLGTESTLKNITHEYLYLVLSERTNSGKITFFTTNLSKDGILARYGERLYSRLFDKNISFANILNGKDLRI